MTCHPGRAPVPIVNSLGAIPTAHIYIYIYMCVCVYSLEKALLFVKTAPVLTNIYIDIYGYIWIDK